MPNAWEAGPRPESELRRPTTKLDFDNDGYINLVEYVNEAGEFPAPAPIVFNGATNNRYAQITNWKTNDGVTAGSNWQPTKYDEALINSGTVVVDAVGQHAFFLKSYAEFGDIATLNVTSGWIDVADDLHVGQFGMGAVNQSGGNVVTLSLSLGSTGVYNLQAGNLVAGGINTGPGEPRLILRAAN